uniref:ATP synthase complex subunit 8 n=1 Tax=Adhemarius dentoni TaxID=1086114 RepID=A0A6G6D7Q4_9NEOP|nr:ATP synthase F0 subunit 8 [Adhemarius dentoni]QIE12540.1 ATP synthase F0 subunit 8 [Adhemarius dentoni]
MPQMMPINWMTSLFFFICIYILFNIMNYYIYLNSNNKKKILNTMNNKNKLIWKW